ncbi:MAG: hypothetical protein INR71_11315, partial [Terriglobus roseus]|nr:hypothetical protein [Terriglobus roseus]
MATPSASSKLRAPEPVGRAPSPTPSNSSASGLAKQQQRRPAAPTVPFSQPADTGKGNFIITQVLYAEEYLRDKDRPMSFADIWDYLSIGSSANTTTTQNLFRTLLQSGRAKIVYDP